ncbi:MAG: nuclear transport factor 2 family protein [Hyphomonadaceae bacterium]|nr:nuclear transport factor 2 family protein [Hyphomonadaceae bacterium]
MRRILLAAVFAFAFMSEGRAETVDRTRGVAAAFLNQAFARGDVGGAHAMYAAAHFKEHDPAIGDGLQAHRDYFRTHRRFARRAHVVDMLIVDGDLFAVMHHGFRDGRDRGAVAVDLWRVEAGRIAEHWNVTQDIPRTAEHANGMACGVGETYQSARALGERALRDTRRAPACGLPNPSASRDETRRVVGNYVAEFGRGGVRSAVELWFAPNYRQHSPTIPDGAAGAIAFLEREFSDPTAEKPQLGPQRVLVEGDLILFHHSITYPGDARPIALIDIFRVANGKISEHWDLKQPTPETAANDNGVW